MNQPRHPNKAKTAGGTTISTGDASACGSADISGKAIESVELIASGFHSGFDFGVASECGSTSERNDVDSDSECGVGSISGIDSDSGSDVDSDSGTGSDVAFGSGAGSEFDSGSDPAVPDIVTEKNNTLKVRKTYTNNYAIYRKFNRSAFCRMSIGFFLMSTGC